LAHTGLISVKVVASELVVESNFSPVRNVETLVEYTVGKMLVPEGMLCQPLFHQVKRVVFLFVGPNAKDVWLSLLKRFPRFFLSVIVSVAIIRIAI
jgi:hypothetical protein